MDDDFGLPPLPPPGAPPVAPPKLPDLPSPSAMAGPRMLPPLRPAPAGGARAKAGLGVIAAAAGLGIGGAFAGPLGALAGLTGVGAVRNLYRAQGIGSSDPTERGDAARSLALGVIGLGIVGFLGYKLYSSSKEKDDG